jgi:hypothetical protein
MRPCSGCCQRSSPSKPTIWRIEDAELAAVEGSAQIGFELETGDGAAVHVGIEEFGAASAHGLGTTQGGAGVAQGSSARACWAALNAIPMLTAAWTGPWSRIKGAATAI